MNVLKKFKRKRKGGIKHLKNTREVIIKPFGVLKELGPLIDLTYQWTDGHYYLHRFDSKSRPLLIYDEKGQMFIIDGKYTVSDKKGIIDL